MATDIREILAKFRSGAEEEAFFELLEMPGDVIPHLIGCFRSEALPAARAFLVKVAWERRNESVIPFLDEALRDSEEDVWQEALDGLVTLASAESLEVLQSARSREFADGAAQKRFCLWLEEATEQVKEELRR